MGTATDDYRHSQVVHLAKGVSVRDLREQVKGRCPENTPIPSESYIQLKFFPSRKGTRAAERYTGRLKIKRMVQQRQWRKQHVDSHYAACIFRYQREFAVKLRNSAIFACVDDKHRVKIGEISCPVAAAEQGRQVIVNSGTSFQVADQTSHSLASFPLLLCWLTSRRVCLDRGMMEMSVLHTKMVLLSLVLQYVTLQS